MEQRDGAAFVLLAQSKESCPFNDKDNVENRNDYTCSTLKERIDKWVEALPRTSAEAAAILPFEVDLSCTDRGKSYGTITVKAAPLTLWQYGQFKELIPLNEDDWYWLVTPWACRWLRSPYTRNTSSVWYVNSSGNYNYNSNASNSYGIRPALLLNSDLLVSLADEVEDDCCGECDCCGGKLVIRKDDQPATVLDRLKAYHEQTEPLVDFYRQRGKLAVIPFNDSIEATTAEIMKALEA